MKFTKKLPTEKGIYWAKSREHPEPALFMDSTLYYLLGSSCPCDPALALWGDRIEAPTVERSLVDRLGATKECPGDGKLHWSCRVDLDPEEPENWLVGRAGPGIAWNPQRWWGPEVKLPLEDEA